MTQLLQDIFQLEDSEQFDKVFQAYSEIYSKNKSEYEVWNHFYFFLWTAIEDAPSSFNDKIDLRRLLQVMLNEGKQTFAEKADFNFIAGYTVSIFPYEYGDFDDLEKEAKQMLLKATNLEPENSIYKMVYLGSISKADNQVYRKAAIEAAPKVLETFSGNGALNKYFRQVLYSPIEKL
ncbi:MAG: hypothetical protein H0U87_02320 [Acidobacteria bacterium]|jgi:hypothetical protein|nr:hypothetical protein [Acidobacteriota bacterium]